MCWLHRIWLFSVFLLQITYVNTEEILLDRIICADGYDGNHFNFTTCYRYPEAMMFPFCVYMVVPSNQTHPGQAVYGCVYAEKLPQQCINDEEFFTPYTTVEIKKRKYTGALYCCMDDYCNEMEEPVYAQVRLMDDSQAVLKESWPILVCIFVLLTGAMPLLLSSLTDRYKKSQRKAEAPWLLEEKPGEKKELALVDAPRHMNMKAQFASLKKMQEILKHCDTAYRHPVNLSYEENDLAISPDIITLQQDDFQCKKVRRVAPTKLSSLALRMIEHGPYEFDFDPIELGDLFDSCAQILGREPSLLELSGDIDVYGNLEGSYADLFRWLNMNGWPPRRKVLFMGGLSKDGQKYSLETMALIFALKKHLPNHVYIVRGVSEVYPMSIENRFSRCVTRCLCDVIQRCCGYLPLAATIMERIFICHGGLPLQVTKLDQIRDIRRPLHHIQRGSLAADLIFSQPSDRNETITGSRGCRFDPLSNEFLNSILRIGIEMVIRSRNEIKGGYKIMGLRVISIWSHPGKEPGNAGIACHIATDRQLSLAKLAAHGTFTKEQVDAYTKQMMVDEAARKKAARAGRDKKSKEKTTHKKKK